MSNTIKPVPEGFQTVTAYLGVPDVIAALDFYRRAFGAEERERVADSKGTIRHAEMRIGSSMVMLGQNSHRDTRPPGAWPQFGVYLYVEDAEAVAKKAVAAGGKELYPVTLQPYGNKEGGIEDPFGIVWFPATHVEDLSEEELARRTATMFK